MLSYNLLLLDLEDLDILSQNNINENNESHKSNGCIQEFKESPKLSQKNYNYTATSLNTVDLQILMPPPSSNLFSDQKAGFQQPKFGSIPKTNQVQSLYQPLRNSVPNKSGEPRRAAKPNSWEQPSTTNSKAGSYSSSIGFHSELQKRKLDETLTMTGLASNGDHVQSFKRNSLNFGSNNSNKNSGLANSSKLSFKTSSLDLSNVSAPPLPSTFNHQQSFTPDRKGSSQNGRFIGDYDSELTDM